MVDNANMAADMGYLTIAEGTLIPLSQTRRLPPEEVVLLTTGSQGEPTSALVRIANQDHREVQVMPGDTVIISATPIPGNELLVSRTIDNLLRQGAKVLYDRIALVHVHGHASQEELKMMLSLTRPRYFVPVHGEYRHLMAHARLAWDLGVADSGIFVLEDGDVLELSEDGGQVVETVSAGPIYIDGLTTHDIRSQVLRDRRTLARDGVVAAIISLNRKTCQLAGPPQIVASGFMSLAETIPMFGDLSSQLEQLLAEEPDLSDDLELMKSKVRETARKFLFNTTHRRPMIIPVILET
jgi:ribonuclease J